MSSSNNNSKAAAKDKQSADSINLEPKKGGERLPTIDRISELRPDEAKWTELRKIEWRDQTNKSRIWESCSRKTRSESGIDAVAILPLLISPTSSHPPLTLLILQYRPPIGTICVELPAGLIDKGETAQEAAVRELREETGLKGEVVQESPTIVSDPGLTDANMRIITVKCEWEGKGVEDLPKQELDGGEFIERRLVEVGKLWEVLEALSKEEGKTVDARLYHWALGLHTAKQISKM